MPFMEYVRAEQKVFGVGIDHPDLTGDRDKTELLWLPNGISHPYSVNDES